MSSTLQRSRAERIFHALLFEGLAIAICSPVLAWAMGRSTGRMSALTLVFSLMAMSWNVLFNALFDRWQQRAGFVRGWWVRIGHAIGFEGGLILATVPFAAWWLEIGLWAAFLLDASMLVFFLPYTLFFNWGYDRLRVVLISARG